MTPEQAEAMSKRCTQCDTVKDLTEFHRGNARMGRSPWCKPCAKAQRAQRYLRDRAAILERQRQYARANPDKYKHYRAKYNARRRYGITLEERRAMYEAQSGCCAICTVAQEFDGARGLYVDHNHTTLKVRGLLCSRCNMGLHYLEAADWLKSALAYLERTK
jgi:hypothetical protein